MTAEEKRPFHSLSFTMIEGSLPRVALRMAAQDEGMYELHAEKGSATNPTRQFTRAVPVDVALRLRDVLQQAGVFGWDEAYGNAEGAPARRWTLSVIFQEGVFSLASKGGSAVPAGFEQLLEELYRLDMPRPGEGASGRAGAAKTAAGAPGAGAAGLASALGSLGLGSIGGMSAGDIGAYGAVGQGPGAADFSGLSDLLSSSGGEIQELMAEMQRNPQALQQRMKDEFKHMSPDEQNRLLDTLAATGMASRAWWERFLRG